MLPHTAFPSTLIAFIQFISASHARPSSDSKKKNTATKRLLFFDGSYQRRRKAQPTSIARLDLHAFPIHALDRTSLQPQAQSLPCHQSPASPLELQTERSSTNTCVMSAAQIAQPRIPLQADLRRCGPRAIVWPLTPAKLETLS